MVKVRSMTPFVDVSEVNCMMLPFGIAVDQALPATTTSIAQP
jgi:hypothetical protein